MQQSHPEGPSNNQDEEKQPPSQSEQKGPTNEKDTETEETNEKDTKEKRGCFIGAWEAKVVNINKEYIENYIERMLNRFVKSGATDNINVLPGKTLQKLLADKKNQSIQDAIDNTNTKVNDLLDKLKRCVSTLDDSTELESMTKFIYDYKEGDIVEALMKECNSKKEEWSDLKKKEATKILTELAEVNIEWINALIGELLIRKKQHASSNNKDNLYTILNKYHDEVVQLGVTYRAPKEYMAYIIGQKNIKDADKKFQQTHQKNNKPKK